MGAPLAKKELRAVLRTLQLWELKTCTCGGSLSMMLPRYLLSKSIPSSEKTLPTMPKLRLWERFTSSSIMVFCMHKSLNPTNLSTAVEGLTSLGMMRSNVLSFLPPFVPVVCRQSGHSFVLPRRHSLASGNKYPSTKAAIQKNHHASKKSRSQMLNRPRCLLKFHKVNRNSDLPWRPVTKLKSSNKLTLWLVGDCFPQ